MRDPKDILAGMQQEEWDSFLTSAYPMLQSQAKKLNTLSTDYYNNAIKNANTTIAMQKGDRQGQREAMGMALAGQDAEGQNRYDSLTATTALNSSANTSVDEANKTKQQIAGNLLGMQTSIKNQAINDASAASGMATGRDQQGIINKAQDKQQTMQGVAAIGTTIAVLF